MKDFPCFNVKSFTVLQDCGDIETYETTERSLSVVSHHGVRHPYDDRGVAVVTDEITHPEGVYPTLQPRPLNVEEDVGKSWSHLATSSVALIPSWCKSQT